MVNATKVLVTSRGTSAEAVLIDEWHAVIYTDVADLRNGAGAVCTILREGHDDEQVDGRLLVGYGYAGVEVASPVQEPYEATQTLPPDVEVDDALEALGAHVKHWSERANNDDVPWVPPDWPGHIEGVVHWVCVLLRGRRC